MSQGTTFKLTQFGKIVAAFSEAVAIAVEDMDPKAALAAVSNKCEKLTAYTRLVFAALQTEQELALVDKRSQTENKMLVQYVAGFAYGGRRGKFIAKDAFKKDNPDGIKFSGFGNNFTSKFLGKAESNVPAGELKAHKLLRGSKDPAIIVALGDNHESFLADLYALLLQQKNGESGLLLTNGYANIFYIRGAEGILWAVYAHWIDDGWYVDAYSIGFPNDWRAGCRAFSR